MKFEWDENKNQLNRKKHGISFQTASMIFIDPFLISILDNRFDYPEDRWQSIGLISGIVIYVAHTILEGINDEEIIRIISARAATSNEEQRYYFYRRNRERTKNT